MVNMGLSTKKEKDDRFQHMKKEVAELIRMRIPYIKSKALEQQAGSSDDFQEIGNGEKEVIKRKYSMDDTLEDKICDLYDLYIEGLDEDAGTLVRKLYAELAQLWPDGFMEKHGIKRAICRAKDRKRALYNRHKDQEKLKRRKLVPRTEETVRVETSSVAQPQHKQEKMILDSTNHSLASLNSPASNTATASIRMPVNIANGPNLDRPKQEKGSSNPIEKRTSDGLTEKKVKKKPELESGEAHIRSEKSASGLGEERHKCHKLAPALLQKSSFPMGFAVAPSQNSEQPI